VVGANPSGNRFWGPGARSTWLTNPFISRKTVAEVPLTGQSFALDAAGGSQPLPYELDGNKPFFQAAKGLVHSLMELGRKQAAKEVCQRIAPLDPSDPLGIQRIAQR
jgi:hypothetical protein